MQAQIIPFSSNPVLVQHQFCDCTFDYYAFDHEVETGVENKDNKQTEMQYLGNGVFKCPACNRTEDFSKVTYKVRLQFKKVFDKNFKRHFMEIEILEPTFDERLNTKWEPECVGTIKEALAEDLEDEFKHHQEGVFDCEIAYNYYRCSYEYEEYDVNLEIIAEAQVNVAQSLDNSSIKEGRVNE